ncbi:MAG: Flp pilus assembly protein CpaB [Syntrophomonas sp.]
MFKGTRKYWAIAIICGLIASFLSYQYIQTIKNRYEPDNLVKIVKASQNIKKDTIITAEQITVEKIPDNYVHPDAIKDKQLVVGKTAVREVFPGEQMLKQDLLSSSSKTGRLAYSIPVNKRGISVPIDSISGVSGYIKPGDRVDIIGTIEIPIGEKPVSFSVYTLQNIEVLAMPNNQTDNGKKIADDAKSIVLAVAPQEAQRLVLASEKGNLRLLLRSPVDKSWVVLPPYQLTDFLK